MALGLGLLIATGQTGYHQALTPDLLLGPAGTVVFPTTLRGVLRGVAELRLFAIIELGALFLLEQDRLYAGITLVVLAILLASIVWLG